MARFMLLVAFGFTALGLTCLIATWLRAASPEAPSEADRIKIDQRSVRSARAV